MRVRGLRWARYRVPFAADVTTAHGRRATRDGLILWLDTDAGLTGLGEAAPLPEFGGGTTADTERLLMDLTPTLTGLALADLPRVLADLRARPGGVALACALDTAALDVAGQMAGVPLARLLTSGQVASSVPVNATVGARDTGAAVEAARRAADDGFGTLKLKVGLSGSLGDEVERVAAVRTTIGPAMRLRLDANGAWSPDVAIDILRHLAAYDLELVEQPVAAGDLTGLARVRRAVEVPIAADEAVSGAEAVREIARRGAADVVVVKPMVVGGPRAARAIIEEAVEAGMAALVTSSMEAGIGVAAALHLAATLPDPPACGLATGELLTSDLLLRPLPVEAGRMPLPAGSGLGVALDPDALRVHTVSR